MLSASWKWDPSLWPGGGSYFQTNAWRCWWRICNHGWAHLDNTLYINNVVKVAICHESINLRYFWHDFIFLKHKSGVYMMRNFCFRLGKYLSGEPQIHFGTSLKTAITISSVWFNSLYIEWGSYKLSQAEVLSENLQSIHI